ncbi:MAG: acyl-CoA dehydrogenase [Acidimicrobiia bacterium]|nr:acyl-CoA dehydrogenase [Acidimicrobiia bacterium]NNC42042.1 acyl-CoA dehydrogenase [Acidimicrobiia bacterium]NNL27866.1 acyl-CoA dehydrogenase [Acidimicrobiia bacterium]
MTHYKTNLRDIEFNLFEANDGAEYYGSGEFSEVDPATARHILREVERLSVHEFAASFEDADRNPPVFENHEVVLPDSLKASLAAFYDGGWDKLAYPVELGGFGAPPSLRWAAQELLVGANPSAYFYVSGGLMGLVLYMVGTTEQQERFVKPMIENRWGGTMVLTEPDAGSDVGAGTTKAIHVEGDVYHLEGIKRFITSGEQDYSDNIIHLVLARPEGARPGTKGLSMFIVPKFHVNEDGTLGDRNGVFATNVEKKMGLKASTTCELSFGTTETPAVGYLVGGVHDGIRQMFHVIESARMLIGTKSIATLSTGYLNALEFANERVQSADLTEAMDKTAPRVTIISHPNVRRMLMLQKSHVEGMRALLYFTAWVQDQKVRFPEDEAWDALDDLLLPLVKGYSSEKAYELLAQSLQVFGGSGFLQDYPIEQYIRDAKIDTLYEGTTGIQGLDLFFRKIIRDQGQTVTKLAERVLEVVKGGSDEFSVERELLGNALENTQGQIGALVGYAMASQSDPTELYKAGLHTNHLLESLSEVVIGWLLLRHAEIAHEALAGSDESDRAFYEGKIASARFFARNVLPAIEHRRRLAETETGWLMDLPTESF